MKLKRNIMKLSQKLIYRVPEDNISSDKKDIISKYFINFSFIKLMLYCGFPNLEILYKEHKIEMENLVFRFQLLHHALQNIPQWHSLLGSLINIPSVDIETIVI